MYFQEDLNFLNRSHRKRNKSRDEFKKGTEGGWERGGTLPIFCNHFEELQTVLFEVELIINNAPSTNV